MVTHNSRLQGGDDSASERYIFTLLNPLTRLIFPEADDSILQFLDDDGTQVEPEFYVPIIPFALINGISGIGTGFSCNIPSYNPLEIIHYLKERLTKGEFKIHNFIPFYEGFKGTVNKIADQKYLIKGCYEKIGEDSIRITELPVGSWTMPYITFLEGLMDGSVDKSGKKIPPTIRDFTSICTEVAVNIVVTFPKGKLNELEGAKDAQEINGVEKLLKLTTSVSTTNIHMFNKDFKLHKYTNIEEIISEFYDIRLHTYQKRKDFLILNMRSLLKKLSNRARYILALLDGSVDLRKKTNVEVTELLKSANYDMLEGDYKYLTKMAMDSVTNENVKTIIKEKEDTEKELNILIGTTIETIWLKELGILETEYMKYKQYREKIQNVEEKNVKKSMVIKKITKK